MTRAKKARPDYEKVLSDLHTVAIEFAGLESQEAIYSRGIEAAEHLLEFDRSVIAVERGGQLHPEAVSSGLDPDEFTIMSTDDGIAGKTYRTGQSLLIDDTSERDEANPTGPWMSAISVPIDEFGNFQAVSVDPATFNDQDLQLAELLMTHVSHHLNRIRKRERLERQNVQEHRLRSGYQTRLSRPVEHPQSSGQTRGLPPHD